MKIMSNSIANQNFQIFPKFCVEIFLVVQLLVNNFENTYSFSLVIIISHFFMMYVSLLLKFIIAVFLNQPFFQLAIFPTSLFSNQPFFQLAFFPLAFFPISLFSTSLFSNQPFFPLAFCEIYPIIRPYVYLNKPQIAFPLISSDHEKEKTRSTMLSQERRTGSW